MNVKYIGGAPAMNYILGVVEPGKIYKVTTKHGHVLVRGQFVEVRKHKDDKED